MMPECVRMVGYPFGQADDSAGGLVWTQATLGKTYDLLRMADERRPPDGWAQQCVADRSKQNRIDLRGAPLFAHAARLADLAFLNARCAPDRIGRLVVADTFGGWIVPYAAKAVARRGYLVACLWRPSESRHELEASTLVCACAPDRKSDSHLMAIAPGSPFRVSEPPVGPWKLSRAAADAVAEHFGQASRDPTATFAAAVLPPESGSHFALLQAALRALGEPNLTASAIGALDNDFHVRQAVKLGIEADLSDHAFLSGLANRIRVPTSERSRRQAG
jgi:hypothetical protein